MANPSQLRAFGRLMVAAAVLAGVFGWEELSIRRERSEETSHIIANLRLWTLSKDSVSRARLQAELEARIDRLKCPGSVATALPPDLTDNLVASRLVTQWAEQDRLGALSWLAGQANPPERWLALVLDHWITDEPVAAERYAREFPPGPWKTRVLSVLAREAIQNRFPQRAIALLEQIPSSSTSEELLNFAVGEWARRDEVSLRKWIENRPDARQRSAFFDEMTRALAMKSEND